MERKTFDDFKQEIAEEMGFVDWNHYFYESTSPVEVEKNLKKVVAVYTRECCQASLNKAAEKATTEFEEAANGMSYPYVDKESITDPSNIVIL